MSHRRRCGLSCGKSSAGFGTREKPQLDTIRMTEGGRQRSSGFTTVSGLPPGFRVTSGQNAAESSYHCPWPILTLYPTSLCTLGMSNEIRHLFVTLKRSFAGTRETHINIVRSLGLRKREQTVQKANVASVRGAIDKVRLCRPYEAYLSSEGLNLSQTISPAGETLSHHRDRPGKSSKTKPGGSKSCSPFTYHSKPLGVTMTTG